MWPAKISTGTSPGTHPRCSALLSIYTFFERQWDLEDCILWLIVVASEISIDVFTETFNWAMKLCQLNSIGQVCMLKTVNVPINRSNSLWSAFAILLGSPRHGFFVLSPHQYTLVRAFSALVEVVKFCSCIEMSSHFGQCRWVFSTNLYAGCLSDSCYSSAQAL